MSEELIVKLIQSAASLAVGILALVYRRRLAREMAEKFKDVYGRFFNIQEVFESKWMLWYLELAFFVFGLGALIFTIFNITGPINNW